MSRDSAVGPSKTRALPPLPEALFAWAVLRGWFATWLLCRRRSLAHISVALLEQQIGEGCADGRGNVSKYIDALIS